MVVQDAVGSRRAESKAAALARLARHGAEIVTTEMVLFEWLESAEHPTLPRGAGLGEGIRRAAAAMTSTTPSDAALRRAVAVVALLNLAYFGVEFAVARAIGSVSLFADSIDFLEDASVNMLILVALGWSAAARAGRHGARGASCSSPASRRSWTAWQKFLVPAPPAPLPLSLDRGRRLAVNLACALMLARFRRTGAASPGPHSSRPATTPSPTSRSSPPGCVTAPRSAWPDVVVGVGIAAINADAAREVFGAAPREHVAAAKP